jgi:hypothetical protein
VVLHDSHWDLNFGGGQQALLSEMDYIGLVMLCAVEQRAAQLIEAITFVSASQIYRMAYTALLDALCAW